MSEPQLVHSSFSRAIPQLLVLLGLMTAGFLLMEGKSVFGTVLGASIYLVYSRGIRWLVTRHHRQGARAFAENHFDQAITCFRKSVDFFEAHRWIDTWRGFVLLSATVPSYREMGLFNIATSLVRSGRVEEGRQILGDIQKEYPDSQIAAGLADLIQAIARVPDGSAT